MMRSKLTSVLVVLAALLVLVLVWRVRQYRRKRLPKDKETVQARRRRLLYQTS